METTVTITTDEYATLIDHSMRLNCCRDYIQEDDAYISESARKILAMLMGVQLQEKKHE